MPSLWDLLNSGDISGAGTEFNNVIGQNRNSLIGLGLGLAGGGLPAALQGYQAGANTDVTDRYRQAQIRQHQQELAFRKSEGERQRGQWQQQFEENKRQFGITSNKPTIHFTPDREDETGNVVPGKAFMVTPDGAMRELSPQAAQNLSQSSAVTTVPSGGVAAAPSATAPFTAPPVFGLGPGGFGAPTPAPQAADQTAIPSTAAPVQQQTSPILPIHRKKAIAEYSKEVGGQQAKTQEREQIGGRVFSLIDKLEEKTKDPLFAQASGPAVGWAGQQPIWNPARAMYEYGPSALGAPSTEAKDHMQLIISDTKAIQSELQRAWLQGQGQVTVQEREQINQIIADIASARSPRAAQAMLNNLRDIVGTTFQRGYVAPGAAGPPSAVSTTPSATGGGDPLAEARSAISRGAPRNAVIQRLRQQGIDPTGL